MFEYSKILRFISFLVGLGFLVSAVSGFVELKNDLILSNIFLSIHALILFFFTLCYEFLYDINLNTYLYRGVINTYGSFLILGMTKISLGFGIFGIVFGLVNIFSYFIIKDNSLLEDNNENF